MTSSTVMADVIGLMGSILFLLPKGLLSFQNNGLSGIPLRRSTSGRTISCSPGLPGCHHHHHAVGKGKWHLHPHLSPPLVTNALFGFVDRISQTTLESKRRRSS